MPMMGATAAGPGPEAGVYEALAAAVADPKEFAKRLKSLAEETRKHGEARDEAIAEQSKAIEASGAARGMLDRVATAEAGLRDETKRIKAAASQLDADREGFEAEKSAASTANVAENERLIDWDSRLRAWEAALDERNQNTEASMREAQAARAEWTAKRDKLLAAMG